MGMMLRRHQRVVETQPSDIVSESAPDASAESVSPEYSKTDILRMPKADLIDLAKSNGMEVDEYMNGNTLKDMLISKLVK